MIFSPSDWTHDLFCSALSPYLPFTVLFWALTLILAEYNSSSHIGTCMAALVNHFGKNVPGSPIDAQTHAKYSFQPVVHIILCFSTLPLLIFSFRMSEFNQGYKRKVAGLKKTGEMPLTVTSAAQPLVHSAMYKLALTRHMQEGKRPLVFEGYVRLAQAAIKPQVEGQEKVGDFQQSAVSQCTVRGVHGPAAGVACPSYSFATRDKGFISLMLSTVISFSSLAGTASTEQRRLRR